MNNIPLEYLRTFVVFSKSADINEAAKVLGISQPTVTLHLKSLQTYFPETLFEFHGRKKLLTYFGRCILQGVQDKIEEIPLEIKKVEQKFSSPKNLTLRIGGRKEILDRFAHLFKFPGTINFIPMESHLALNALEKHDLEIAIAHQETSSKSLSKIKIMEEGGKLICHKSILKGKGISFFQKESNLKSIPTVLYKEPSPFLKEWTKKHKIQLDEINIKAIIEDWGLLIRLVSFHRGWSIIPTGISTQGYQDIREFSVSEKIISQNKFYLFHQEDLEGTFKIDMDSLLKI